ncbi:MAG: sigma-70 family RNA polymerase sigma factor [Planctomycetes bacterium]|nr:sigma-70 family RNA polymerase sigma factor [Planctomycetota bacterium]
MVTDGRSDEELLKANCMETLFSRYYEPGWNYIRSQSWYRDKGFIDDLVQQACLTALEKLNNNEFTPSGEGSFKAWFYQICQNVCWIGNKRHRHQPKSLTEIYTEELPLDIADLRPHPKNYDREMERLKKILAQLPEEDRQLMLLMAGQEPGKMAYENIHKTPPFDKYELPNLRQKVCRLRKLMLQLLREIKEKENGKEEKPMPGNG